MTTRAEDRRDIIVHANTAKKGFLQSVKLLSGRLEELTNYLKGFPKHQLELLTLHETFEHDTTPAGKLKEGEEGAGICVSPA